MFNKTLNNEGNKKPPALFVCPKSGSNFQNFYHTNIQIHQKCSWHKTAKFLIITPMLLLSVNAFILILNIMYLLKPWSWIFQRVWRSCFPDQSLRPSPTPIGLHYYTALSPSWRLFSLATTDLEYKMQLVPVSIKLKIQRYSHQCLSTSSLNNTLFIGLMNCHTFT